MPGVTKISVREFAWYHLVTLYRYRRQILPLDSALFLTHGSPLSPTAVISSLNPAREIEMGISPSSNGGPAVIGQMRYKPGERSARLSFILPEPEESSPALVALLEYFAAHAGRHGAYHLLADLEERHPAFESMRRSGFSVYAWQRIWQFQLPRQSGAGESRTWRAARPVDETAIRSLYNSLTPPLVQAAEPLPERTPKGLIYRKEGELLAYTEGVYGPNGILLYPLVHPDVDNVTELIADLVHNFPARLGRPVYLAVRSYQAWLETSMQQLDGQFAPRQALLVKHLVTPQRSEVLSPRYSILEKPQAEPTTSIVNYHTDH